MPARSNGIPSRLSVAARTWSAEPGIAGRCQLYSMKLSTEDWSLRSWSTSFVFARWREDDQRQPWSEAAAALFVGERRDRLGLRSALPYVGPPERGVREVVRNRQGRVGDAAVGVVVPAVGVVPHQDDRGVRPVRRLLERVDLAHHELLLVCRVGVGRVPGLARSAP